MSEPITQTEQNQTPATGPEPAAEKTFTQSEMEQIIGTRLAKAMKGMPSKEELSTFRAWKESQQTEKERWDALAGERDAANAALSAAQTELEQFRREKLLLSKGVPPEDADYYAFKIGKLVTDELPFEKAAEQFMQEKKAKEAKETGSGITVDLTAPLNGSPTTLTLSDIINQKLRGR